MRQFLEEVVNNSVEGIKDGFRHEDNVANYHYRVELERAQHGLKSWDFRYTVRDTNAEPGEVYASEFRSFSDKNWRLAVVVYEKTIHLLRSKLLSKILCDAIEQGKVGEQS